MKKSTVLLVCMVMGNLIAGAQNYSVLFIPDSLTKHANAVKRYEEYRVIIKSADKVIIKHKYAITILNEAGDDHAQYYNSYDKLNDLSNIDGNLYDAMGKKLKNVKKKDIEDFAVQDGFSLMRDDRIKQHDFYYRQYPYTVEYEDEQEQSATYHLPSWQPAEGFNFSVQQSRFIVETPNGYKFRFKQLNYPSKAVATGTQTTWELQNFPAIVSEEYQPPFNEVAPAVYLAPTDFSISGYDGNMNTWLDLGKFQQVLNKGRDQLPEKIKQDIHKLTDGVTDTKEKVKLLYQYLQANNRYISIQLGIGGWQPFDANFVAEKKYGDCKALSNYMVSMLKEAGVPANYVIVNAGKGKRGLWEDFPASIFNHVISCVPMGKDTMWLECTAEYDAAGYMGTFTGNRKALLIADDGGHVVNTPLYTAKENIQRRKAIASIDEKGNLTADIYTGYSGIEQEEVFNLLHYYTEDQRQKKLNKLFDLPTYAVDKKQFTEHKDVIPVIDEYLHVTAPACANVSGKRLFIKPNLFEKSQVKLSADSTRRFDIVYPYAVKDIDTVRITIPAGYTAEAVPKNVSLNNKFGEYNISFAIKENSIEMIRSYTSNAARYPAADYPEMVKFYDAMYKADRGQVVMVKKEN